MDINNTNVENLMNRYQAMLYRIAFSNLKNKADAEDIVQETFMRYIKTNPVYENENHEKAWFIRTTINSCYDLLKSAWYKKTISMSEVLEDHLRNLELPYMEEDDTLQAVMKLPLMYRNPIYLFYYEDYSIKEIAGFLKENESTIKTRLRRGREQIKKLLMNPIS